MDPLVQDLVSYADLRFCSDVILEILPETTDASPQLYHLHKCIITQTSHYFRTLFLTTTPFAERTSGRCVIRVDDPVGVLPDIVNFLYTGRFPLSYRNCVSTYALADRLQIDSLCDYVRSFVNSANLQPRHVFHIYIEATEHAYDQTIDLIITEDLLARNIWGWTDNMIAELPITTLYGLIELPDTDWESPEQHLRVVLRVLEEFYPQGYCENDTIQEACFLLLRREMPFDNDGDDERQYTFEGVVGKVPIEYFRRYFEKAAAGSMLVSITEQDLEMLETDADAMTKVLHYIMSINGIIENWVSKVKFRKMSVEMLEWALVNAFVPKKLVINTILEIVFRTETPEPTNTFWTDNAQMNLNTLFEEENLSVTINHTLCFENITELADFSLTLAFPGQTLPPRTCRAHKAILAWSSGYFLDLFRTQSPSLESYTIHFPLDITSEAFTTQAVLNHLYSRSDSPYVPAIIYLPLAFLASELRATGITHRCNRTLRDHSNTDKVSMASSLQAGGFATGSVLYDTFASALYASLVTDLASRFRVVFTNIENYPSKLADLSHKFVQDMVRDPQLRLSSYQLMMLLKYWVPRWYPGSMHRNRWDTFTLEPVGPLGPEREDESDRVKADRFWSLVDLRTLPPFTLRDLLTDSTAPKEPVVRLLLESVKEQRNNVRGRGGFSN